MMPKAILPQKLPKLPANCNGWARSTRRAGGMFHAHCIGITACRTITIDRFRCEEPKSLGDMQYWGVCPKCFKIGKNSA
jgi:hypothetical protein